MAEMPLSNGTGSIGVAAAASTGSSNKPVVNSFPTEKPVNSKAESMCFYTEEEIILLKEVVACSAHIAKYGSVQNKFPEAVN